MPKKNNEANNPNSNPNPQPPQPSLNNASRGRLIFGIVDKTGEVVGVADPDGDDKLTNAGALLADYCPIYQSRLFCTRWNGLTKASTIAGCS